MEMEMLLTAKDVKNQLKCSLPYVYKAAEGGILPCVSIPCPGEGKRKRTMKRFKPEDIRKFIEKYYMQNRN